MANPFDSCSNSPRGPDASFGLASIDLAVEYRTGTSDPISQFYAPCLAAADQYRRAVGYFRSSIYSIIGPSILAFAKRGGTVFLVCSPELTIEDQGGIAAGYATREKLASERVEAEIDMLLADSKSEWRVRVLATLIATGRMEVKIAVRPPSHGLYHEKIGIFTDPKEVLLASLAQPTNLGAGGTHMEISNQSKCFVVGATTAIGREPLDICSTSTSCGRAQLPMS